MVEYEISDKFCHRSGIIYLGGLGYDKLKDKDKDIFISDAITHEFIHYILDTTFNNITSCLFDFIGDSILNTNILRTAICLCDTDILWCDAIRINGKQRLFTRYDITPYMIKDANIICNTR